MSMSRSKADFFPWMSEKTSSLIRQSVAGRYRLGLGSRAVFTGFLIERSSQPLAFSLRDLNEFGEKFAFSLWQDLVRGLLITRQQAVFDDRILIFPERTRLAQA